VNDALVTLRGTGTVTLPNIPLTPIGGQQFSGNGYFQYREGKPLRDDYVVAWGIAPVVGLLGIEVAFDGSYHVLTNQKAVDQYVP
jgi:hypothetical protein